MTNNLAHFRRFVSTLAVAAAVFVAAESASLASESGNESIGTELLDDLDPSLFGSPADAPADARNAQPGPARPGFDKRILPGAADDMLGEDVGQSSPSNPLVQVERTMREAADLINRDALPAAGDQQRQAVAELDKLIEQLSKQCCGGACKPGDQPKPSSQRSQGSQAKSGSKPGKGSAPARDSNSALRPANPAAVNASNREQLQKDVWGHLPSQVREQMLESFNDEFLPEYELEIEKYFRRLAEEREARHEH